ncbi:MAG: hypothetical protein U5S82_23395 [Gammaproteobacteria bacterium]|nr:hypothetical protein [Gammaproteobacteria bacterium]
MSRLAAYLALWPVLAVIGVANGILREATFGPHLTEIHAHQLSTLLLMALCAIAVWLFARREAPLSFEEALTVGLAWLVLTVAFEFTFGRLVAGHSWHHLLQNYDLANGRLWPLFLGWLALLPWLMGR